MHLPVRKQIYKEAHPGMRRFIKPCSCLSSLLFQAFSRSVTLSASGRRDSSGLNVGSEIVKSGTHASLRRWNSTCFS